MVERYAKRCDSRLCWGGGEFLVCYGGRVSGSVDDIHAEQVSYGAGMSLACWQTEGNS